jgi:hypothetical protein
MHIQRDGDANEIHIFVPAVAANTVYHEAIHEVAPEILGVKGTKKLASALRDAIVQDKALTQYMGDFISKYSGASAAELDDEFTTELASLIASNQVEVTVKRSLATKFLEALNKALGTKFSVQPTSAQLIDAMNSIANALGAGEAISTDDMETGDVIARGVYKGGPTKRKQSFMAADISFEGIELPKNVEVVSNPTKTSMDDALERSGNAFVLINSDGTALRHTEEGLDVYGGFGYSFIKPSRQGSGRARHYEPRV